MFARLLTWSLRRRRGRHALNAVTMAVTVAVVTIFASVALELRGFVKSYAGGKLVRINAVPAMSGGDADLPVAYSSILESIPGVKIVQKQKAMFGGNPNNGGATYFLSGEEDSGIELNQDFFPVTPDVFEAWKKERLGAIVTDATAKALNLNVGSLAELATPAGPLQVKVVGLSYKGKIANRIAVHYDYLQQFTGNKGTCMFRLFADAGVADKVPHEIADRTKNSPMPASGFTERQFGSGTVRRVALVPALLGFLGAFLLFTTALTLANNAAISIRERRTETAALRAIGLRTGLLCRLLVSESVAVGMLGGVIAVGVTWYLFRNGIHLTVGSSEMLFGAVKISPPALVCGLIASVAIPLAGALPAALRAVRVPLVVALRDAA